MNDGKSKGPEIYEVSAARAPLTVLSVERAMGELRRGRPVVVRGGGGHAVLTLAAEAMSTENLKLIQDISGTVPSLAITARRAAVLGLADSAGKIAIVSGLGGLGADEISALANPLVQAGVTPALREKLTVTVRENPGHDCAAAAVALSKIARLLPAAVTATLDDIDDVVAWANRHDFLTVDTGDIFQFETAAVRNLKRIAEARVPISDAHETRIVAFRPADGGREHLAIVVGKPDPDAPVLVRLHSECFTGDLLGSLRCDCGDQLQGALAEIKKAGAGVLLYLAQEGRGIGLINKLRAYELQDLGFDTMDANEQLGFDADERVYMPAARMLKLLGYQKVRLLTNNPDKLTALGRYGVEVVERVAHTFPANQHNEFYLQTKAVRSGHQF
jgi:GTP cyclohydrolase II